MDIQLKRGYLEICILASMLSGETYGYKLIRDVSKYIELSESTLYPILRRLESAGCLTVYSVEHSGRLRKFYHITELGRKQLRDFADSWGELEAMYEFIRGGLEDEQS